METLIIFKIRILKCESLFFKTAVTGRFPKSTNKTSKGAMAPATCYAGYIHLVCYDD